MPTPTATARGGQLDVITSPIAGESLVVELADLADHLAHGAPMHDLSRHLAARVRMLRRTAVQLVELHELDPSILDAVAAAPEPGGGDGE